MPERPVTPLVSAGSPRRARIPMHRAQRWLADGEQRTPQVQVFVTQAAFRMINEHANSDLDNEVGGWLAGRWCRDIETKEEYVVVEALLPAQQVRSGSTFLTFTHDSQVAMLAALEERHAKKGIVGWYHTHPRMGIFLSGYDVWLHDHFFPHPWQIALVLEPHSHTAGFFIRDKKGELNARKYHGFHELLNRNMESTVDWKNLHAEKKPVANPEQPKSQPVKEEPAKVQAAVSVETAKASKPSASSVQPEPQVTVKAKPVATEPPPAAVREQSVKQAPVQAVPTQQGVLKKFEGPKPAAKVTLVKKDPSRKNGLETGPRPSEEKKS